MIFSRAETFCRNLLAKIVAPPPDRLQQAREEGMREQRRMIHEDRRRAAQLGHARRRERQRLNDPILKAAREIAR